MAAAVKLSDLPIGASAIVRELPKSGLLRLREMGLLAGTRVTLVRCAPRSEEHTSELQSLRRGRCSDLSSDRRVCHRPRIAEIRAAQAQGNGPPGGNPGHAGAMRSLWRPDRDQGSRLPPDRKSTRLNSSQLGISYAVFCL